MIPFAPLSANFLQKTLACTFLCPATQQYVVYARRREITHTNTWNKFPCSICIVVLKDKKNTEDRQPWTSNAYINSTDYIPLDLSTFYIKNVYAFTTFWTNLYKEVYVILRKASLKKNKKQREQNGAYSLKIREC